MDFRIITFVILSLGLCNAGVVPRDFMLRKNELLNSTSKSTDRDENFTKGDSSQTLNATPILNVTRTSIKPNKFSRFSVEGENKVSETDMSESFQKRNLNDSNNNTSQVTIATVRNSSGTKGMNSSEVEKNQQSVGLSVNRTSVSADPMLQTNHSIGESSSIKISNVVPFLDEHNSTLETDSDKLNESMEINQTTPLDLSVDRGILGNASIFDERAVEDNRLSEDILNNLPDMGNFFDVSNSSFKLESPDLEHNESIEVANASRVSFSTENVFGNSSISGDLVAETNLEKEILSNISNVERMSDVSNSSFKFDSHSLEHNESIEVANETTSSSTEAVLGNSSISGDSVAERNVSIDKDILSNIPNVERMSDVSNSSFKFSSHNLEHNKSIEVANESRASFSTEHVSDNSSISGDPVVKELERMSDVFNSGLEIDSLNLEHSDSLEMFNQTTESSFSIEHDNLNNTTFFDTMVERNISTVNTILSSIDGDGSNNSHEIVSFDSGHNRPLGMGNKTTASNLSIRDILSNNSNEIILGDGLISNVDTEQDSSEFVDIIEHRNNTDERGSVNVENVDKSAAEGIFSNTAIDFLLKSDVVKNAALAMEIFNFSDSLTDHIIEENEFHSFLAVTPSVLADNPVLDHNVSVQEPNAADNTSVTKTLSETHEISSTLDHIKQSQSNETFAKFNSTAPQGDEMQSHELLKRTDVVMNENEVIFPVNSSEPRENMTETSVAPNLSHLSNASVEMGVAAVEDLATNDFNSTSEEHPECPSPGWCIFWFMAQDTCAKDSHCLGSRICCRIRCSKTCIEIH